MSRKIKDKLRERLELKDPGYIGCVRRNLWTEDEEPWRRIRGHALPAIVADKVTFHTGRGEMEAFVMAERFLVEFRAGQRNDYWVEDIKRRWAFTEYCTGLDLSRTVYLLHENQGELAVKEVHIPEDFSAQEEVREAVEEYEAKPPGRIRKDSERAHRICRYCPVQRQCDLKDREVGDTDDWSENYDQYGSP